MKRDPVIRVLYWTIVALRIVAFFLLLVVAPAMWALELCERFEYALDALAAERKEKQ